MIVPFDDQTAVCRTARTVVLSRIRDNTTYPDFYIIPKNLKIRSILQVFEFKSRDYLHQAIKLLKQLFIICEVKIIIFYQYWIHF